MLSLRRQPLTPKILQGMSTGNVLCLIFLLFNAAYDIRKCSIWWPGCVIGGLAGLLIRLPGGMTMILGALPGLLPGLLLSALSLAAGQALGLGDGLVLLACGMMTDPETVLGMLFIAFFLAGFYALFLLLARKKDRKESFPFVPFLLAGMVLTILSG